MAVKYYFRQLYTVYGGYVLLSTVIDYFRRLYITFSGYILLLALPDCNFVRTQDFLAISRTYGWKGRLKFSINLLALIPFCFFCSTMVSSINVNVPFENSVLLETLTCWKCQIFFTLCNKWFARQTCKPTVYIN